jgi:hypothetical protein
MTSLRQIESNRRNALRSTGPNTETGKQRSSQNAVRHGLTAETVIELLEDPEDYKAFEQAVTADYDAESAVERELVLRLASLLWRLRRSTLIETGLLQIQGKGLRAGCAQRGNTSQDCSIMAALQVCQLATVVQSEDPCCGNEDNRDATPSETVADSATDAPQAPDPRLDVARCFLHLINLDNSVFERLGRYESALWRQVRQTVFTLEALRWRTASARSWRTQHPWQRRIRIPPVAELES